MKLFSKNGPFDKLLTLAALLFAVAALLYSLRSPSWQNTFKQEVSKSPATQKVEPPKQPVPAQPYDPSHDRIWTSVVLGKNYIRDSSSKKGAVEFLQRADDVQITVPAPVAGIVTSIKNNKNYAALTLSDEKGKFYNYRFSKAVVKMGQKVTKGEILGFRPGVARIPVALRDREGHPLPLKPFNFDPPVKKLPPDADKP
jgi:hypothetical protein